MGIDEVVGSFSNEPDIDVQYERVYFWRNLRVSHLSKIKDKLDEMWDEKVFALK